MGDAQGQYELVVQHFHQIKAMIAEDDELGEEEAFVEVVNQEAQLIFDKANQIRDTLKLTPYVPSAEEVQWPYIKITLNQEINALRDAFIELHDI